MVVAIGRIDKKRVSVDVALAPVEGMTALDIYSGLATGYVAVRNAEFCWIPPQVNLVPNPGGRRVSPEDTIGDRRRNPIIAAQPAAVGAC
jgi:hypothetical protein